MKRLLLLFTILLSLGSFSQGNLKYSNWVNDFADILTTEQENVLNAKIDTFERNTDIEFAIVTVKSLEDRDIESFTNDLFNDWKVGKSGKDNGLMILIAPNERQWRIEVGYGLEEYLTDGYTKVEAERVFPEHFKKEDYFGGINPIVDKFQDRLGKMTWAERQADIERKKQEEAESKAAVLNVLKWIGIIILIIICVVIIVALWIRAKRREEERKRLIKSLNNKIKLDASYFNKTLDKVKKLEPNNKNIQKWEKTRNDVSKIVEMSSKGNGVEYVQGKSTELLSVIGLTMGGLTYVLNKHKDFDEIKSYINGNNLDSSIQNIKRSISRFKVANEKGDYSIKWSDMKILNNIDLSKKLFTNIQNNLDINNIDKLRLDYKKCKALVDNSVNIIIDYESELNKLYSSRKNTKNGLGELPGLIDKMDKKCKDSDVSSSTRRKAKDVKEKISKYKPDYSQNNVVSSWSTLSSLIDEVKRVTKKAQSDIDDEERRRRRRRTSSSSSIGGFGYGGGSSYSSGSSFGGFGGGFSGGGGSSGSW